MAACHSVPSVRERCLALSLGRRLDPKQTNTRQAADDFAWPETENTGALYFQDKFSIDHLFWPLSPVFRSTGPQRLAYAEFLVGLLVSLLG